MPDTSSHPLPNEMLATIFEHLAASPATLAETARVSRRFRAVAERVLYTTVSVTDVLALPTAAGYTSSPASQYRIQNHDQQQNQYPYPYPNKTAAFCTAILSRPHLAEHVKKLSVRWQTVDGLARADGRAFLGHVEPVLGGLSAVLRALYYLESLEIALGLTIVVGNAGMGMTMVTEREGSVGLLSGCVFPALRAFALSGVGRGCLPLKPPPQPSWLPPLTPQPSNDLGSNSDLHPTQDLASFLARTPSITQLRLADLHAPLTLPPPPLALPVLLSFRGSAPTAASLLPGRPVHTLALVGDRFITTRDLTRIAMAGMGPNTSASSVRLLDLSLMSVTPLLLRDFSQHLGRSVVCLRVRLALRHTLHHALSGIVSLLPYPQHLSPSQAVSDYTIYVFADAPCRPELRARSIPGTAAAGSVAHNARRRWCRQCLGRALALLRMGARLPHASPRHFPVQNRVDAGQRRNVVSPASLADHRLSTPTELLSSSRLHGVIFIRSWFAAPQVRLLHPHPHHNPQCLSSFQLGTLLNADFVGLC